MRPVDSDVSRTSLIWKNFELPVTQQQLSFEQNKAAGPKVTSLIDFLCTWFMDQRWLWFEWIWVSWSPYMITKTAAKSAVRGSEKNFCKVMVKKRLYKPNFSHMNKVTQSRVKQKNVVCLSIFCPHIEHLTHQFFSQNNISQFWQIKHILRYLHNVV